MVTLTKKRIKPLFSSSESAEYNHEDTFYISALIVLSSLAVVFLHYNSVFWTYPKDWGLWVSSNIIETFFYFAVPVFFMVTGCTLIDYKKRCSTKEFFIRRVKKAVIPYLVWSFVAVVNYIRKNPDTDVSILLLLEGVIHHKYIYIYWFFIPLFSIYLCIPVLADIKDKVKTFTYVAIFALITHSLLDFLRHCDIDILPNRIAPLVCSDFLIYPVLGYLFHKQYLTRGVRMIFYVLGLLAVLVHLLGTIFLSGESICTLFKATTHITSVLQAIAVFLFFKYNACYLFRLNIIRNIILFIQPATLGIYLLHLYVFAILLYAGVDRTSLLFRTVGAFLAFIGMAVGIRLVQKWKPIRYILPK